MLRDFRYAARTLLKSPGFTIIAVLALALGSGVNTAIFSVVEAVLLRPLPFPNPGCLIKIGEHSLDNREISLSYPNFLDMRERSRTTSAMAAYRYRGMNLTGLDAALRVTGMQVNWQFFQLLETRPVIGRVLTAADDRVDAPPTVLITAGLWARKFGRQPDVLGKTIALNGGQYAIAGVLPSLPEPFQSADVFIPLTLFATKNDGILERTNHTGMYALGLLAPGVEVSQARSELDRISADLDREYPLLHSGIRASVSRLLDSMVGRLRAGIWALFGAVGFVLLIACVNVANLMLARSSARQREVAVRAALGAGRGAIVRQFLAESLLLAAAGAALGTIAAWWVIDIVVRFAPEVARLPGAHLDPVVLAFTFGLTIVSAILFGLAPAIGASRADVMDAMRSGGRTSTEVHGRDRMRNALLVAEVALTVVLLTGAGLMLRTIQKISDVDPGFDPHGVLALDLNLHRPLYNEIQLKLFWERVLNRIRTIPGVRDASATLNPPFDDSHWSSVFQASNGPVVDRAHLPNSRFTTIATRYFETMGIRLLRGRTFNESDGQHGWTVVVNETLARAMWGDRDPIGQKIKPGFPEMATPWAEVIGVVSDVRQIALDVAPGMEIYLPLTEDDESGMTLMVRAAGDPMLLAPAIEREIRQLNPDLPVYDVRTLDQKMAGSYARQKFSTALLEIFAAIALLLATVGIYGVTSYMVARSTQEIGVRIALGARHRNVVAMVLRRGMLPSITGLAIGAVCAIVAARAMRSMLFGVSASDPSTLGVVAATFLLAALAACFAPAWRATRLDPIEALRAE